MIALALLPIVCSTLLIAAHFYRSGSLLLTAVSLALPLLLCAREAIGFPGWSAYFSSCRQLNGYGRCWFSLDNIRRQAGPGLGWQ